PPQSSTQPRSARFTGGPACRLGTPGRQRPIGVRGGENRRREIRDANGLQPQQPSDLFRLGPPDPAGRAAGDVLVYLRLAAAHRQGLAVEQRGDTEPGILTSHEVVVGRGGLAVPPIAQSGRKPPRTTIRRCSKASPPGY